MAHEEHPTAPNNTPAPQQSPVRTLRSQAEDARAYRREHDLCFYCGGNDHTLKDCRFAPHNRGYTAPSRKGSTSTLGTKRSGNLANSVHSIRTNMSTDTSSAYDEEQPSSPGAASARACPGLLRRLGLTGTPPSDLTESQWQECLNACLPDTLAAKSCTDVDLSNITASSAVDALRRYIMIRFPDPISGRCPSPNLELNPANRRRVMADVQTWECLPIEWKQCAIDLLKPTEEQKLMAALDAIGEKVMSSAPNEVKQMFEGVLEWCVKDEEDGAKSDGGVTLT